MKSCACLIEMYALTKEQLYTSTYKEVMTKGDNFNKSDDFKIGMHIYMWFLIICLSLKKINATAAGKCQMLTTDSQMISSLTKYNPLGHVKTQPLEPFTFKPHGQVHTHKIIVWC